MKYILLLCLTLTILVSCQDDDASRPSPSIPDVDCTNLINGITDSDKAKVLVAINELFVGLLPSPSDEDEIGHKINLEAVVKQIEAQCPLVSASLNCYACFETFPATSEIEILIDLTDVSVMKVIDVKTPENGELHASSVHD